MTPRDCRSCAHHNPEARSLDDAPEVCWGCSVTRNHANWKPMPPTPPAAPVPVKAKPAPDPLKVQVGGGHYKDLAIQPMEYSMANKLDACQHSVVKYVTRFRQKNGIQDLEKAKHILDLLIAFEQAK